MITAIIILVIAVLSFVYYRNFIHISLDNIEITGRIRSTYRGFMPIDVTHLFENYKDELKAAISKLQLMHTRPIFNTIAREERLPNYPITIDINAHQRHSSRGTRVYIGQNITDIRFETLFTGDIGIVVATNDEALREILYRVLGF